MPDGMGSRGGGGGREGGGLFPSLVTEMGSRVREKMKAAWWRRERSWGEVLMGKRRMACQCQKWSCAEERLGENEREDGREGLTD